MSAIYFKNISNDGSWTNLSNWFLDDIATIQAASAPWVGDDSGSYLDYDLYYAIDQDNNISCIIDVENGIIKNTQLSQCFLNVAVNSGTTVTINANFSSNFILNSGADCTISGGNYNNISSYAGTIINDGSINSGVINSSIINGGSFSSVSIVGSTINDGSFDYNCSFDSCSIGGGSFSEITSGLSLSISGGIFWGVGLANSSSISGGSFNVRMLT